MIIQKDQEPGKLKPVLQQIKPLREVCSKYLLKAGYLERFFLPGSSASIPVWNRFSSVSTTTRAPIYSWSSFGVLSKAMWWPETRLFPFPSNFTLYFTRPSSANDKLQMKNTTMSFDASLLIHISYRSENIVLSSHILYLHMTNMVRRTGGCSGQENSMLG